MYRTTIGPTGSPAAIACCIAAISCSSWAVRGRPPCPGASIEWTGCGWGLCDTLGTFLGSRSRRIFEWPLATDVRRHVHTRIDSAGLPVRHQTRRQGRPYTLVLTKTGELFTREKDTRHKAVTDLAWLTSAWSDGSLGTSLLLNLAA